MLLMLVVVVVGVKMSLTETAGDGRRAEWAAGEDALASEDNFLRALLEKPPGADRPPPRPRPVPLPHTSPARSGGTDNTHANRENLFKTVEEYLRPDLEYIESAAVKLTRRYGGAGGPAAEPLPSRGVVTQRPPSIRRHLAQHLRHTALPQSEQPRLRDASFKHRRRPRHRARHKGHNLLAEEDIDHRRVVNEPLYELKSKQEDHLFKTEVEGIEPIVNLFLRPNEQEQTYEQLIKGSLLHRMLQQGRNHIGQAAPESAPDRPTKILSPPPVAAGPAATPRSAERAPAPPAPPAPVRIAHRLPAAGSPPRPLSPSLLLPPLPLPPPRPLTVPPPIPVTVPVPIPQILWSTAPQTQTTTSTIRHKGLERFLEFIKKNRKFLMRLMGNKRIAMAQAGIMGLQETSRTSHTPAPAAVAAQRRVRARAGAGAHLTLDTATPYYKAAYTRNPKYNQNTMTRMDSATPVADDGGIAQVNVLTTKHIPSALEIAQEKEALALLARLQASAGRGTGGRGRGTGGGDGPVMRVRDAAVGGSGPKPHHHIIPIKVLDMAPARGSRIADLRNRRRLCQRHILNPEGPKYRRNGAPYIQAFRAVKGRDFAVTRAPSLLIPICCNCCVKSVLGCE